MNNHKLKIVLVLGSHVKKSGKSFGITTWLFWPVDFKYKFKPRQEPIASPSGFLWPIITQFFGVESSSFIWDVIAVFISYEDTINNNIYFKNFKGSLFFSALNMTGQEPFGFK